ncbi:cell division protein FtsQ/DivIB [Magnetospirillum sp. SS-4]|uniref:cell division protein FtsQ/DivIB n=1 Tax=Magnetospirillum sp. SS-4 TaxID=2681465 RepID=UPI00137C5809|nr:cell division protein FtsQ/DivIB [Magnetospirillum sp. SS-4]CAA7622929.1 Cell division protein FtsQ [Magnetospirillum sp. SS-4]
MRRISDTDIVVTADDRPGTGRTQAPARARTKPKPRAKRRTWWPRLWLSPLQRLAGAGVIATALLVGGAVLWRSGMVHRVARDAGAALLAVSADAGLRVAEITVEGRRRTPTEQIIVALATRHGDPILGVDIAVAKARLENLPSVRAAAIERRLPGALHLSIVERQPVALWQNGGRFMLVDREGHRIPGAIEGFEDLPLVVGEGAPQRADELFAMLATEPALAARVKAATRVGNRRWNLRLDDVERGLEARLPETDPEAAWRRLAGLERDRGLSSKQITMIDLRVPERLIMRSDPQQAAGRAASAEHGRED